MRKKVWKDTNDKEEYQYPKMTINKYEDNE